MVPITRDYRDFLALLVKHEVRFLIAGGFALAAHGHPRFTKDIDIWVEATPDNARRLLTTIDEFGFADLGLVEADFTAPEVVVQLGHEPNRIDLLTGVTGLDFADAHPRRITGRFGDIDVPILDRASLIVNKRAVGRPQDLADVALLEADEEAP